MKLSIIIVNYNVQYFLEQALLSVRKAVKGLDVEVFVVDNSSVDDSVEMVREKFPEVIMIANRDNVGFSRANNQAMRIAKGDYILLLNPDTVVREDTFHKTVAFMDAHPEAGGLGVKMIDGTGKFLPESKRGFPSPEVAFYKTFGLSKLFPRSKKFNRYHLGYLDEDENHEIEILSGAFMMMRKTVLDKIGYLDEEYFMYGEDIDLSYRIIKAGYKNYYFADTIIIHYKGESTKKGSLNYVKTFYNAMIIFTKRHFQGDKAKLFIAMLRFAIYFRAFLTLVSNWAKSLYAPVLDAIFMLGSLFAVTKFWAYWHFQDSTYYDFQPSLYYFNFPLYILTWLIILKLRGAYDRQAQIGNITSGIALGTLIIAAVYGFLPLDLRSSRMIILLGAGIGWLSAVAWRSFKNLARTGYFGIRSIRSVNLIIVGNQAESKRVLSLLYQSELNMNFIGTVSTEENQTETKDFLGDLHQLEEVVHIYNIEEIIFCSQDIASERIIYWMTRLGGDLSYKIVPEHSESIIGSNSKNSAGDLYTIDIRFNIASTMHQRNKRIFDIGLALLGFVLAPLICWIMKHPLGFWANIFQVLFGQKSWVGYATAPQTARQLPKLKNGVLNPTDGLRFEASSANTVHRLNLFYAKDYKVATDWNILWRNWRLLGKSNDKKEVKEVSETEDLIKN